MFSYIIIVYYINCSTGLFICPLHYILDTVFTISVNHAVELLFVFSLSRQRVYSPLTKMSSMTNHTEHITTTMNNKLL